MILMHLLGVLENHLGYGEPIVDAFITAFEQNKHIL
jgi:hypothetical protein